jgi:hypothetical protein
MAKDHASSGARIEMKERRQAKPDPQKAPDTEERRRKRYKQHLDERLDEALEETFPASDPVALTPRRRQVVH